MCWTAETTKDANSSCVCHLVSANERTDARSRSLNSMQHFVALAAKKCQTAATPRRFVCLLSQHTCIVSRYEVGCTAQSLHVVTSEKKREKTDETQEDLVDDETRQPERSIYKREKAPASSISVRCETPVRIEVAHQIIRMNAAAAGDNNSQRSTTQSRHAKRFTSTPTAWHDERQSRA